MTFDPVLMAVAPQSGQINSAPINPVLLVMLNYTFIATFQQDEAGSAPDFLNAVPCLASAVSRQTVSYFTGPENHEKARPWAPFEVPQHKPSPMSRHIRTYTPSE